MYHVRTVLGTDALSVYLFIFVLVKDRRDKFARIGFLIILKYFFYLYQLTEERILPLYTSLFAVSWERRLK